VPFGKKSDGTSDFDGALRGPITANLFAESIGALPEEAMDTLAVHKR
jgi:hypothetical protein